MFGKLESRIYIQINLRDEYAAQAVLYPNLLPYSNILVSDASAVLVRQ